MAEQEYKLLKVTSGFLNEEMSIFGIVTFIEEKVSRGIGFPVYQRLAASSDVSEFPIPQNPIVGFCGVGTLPLIGNPDADSGVFAVLIDERKLIYDSKGTPPHRMRDSYRWQFPPYHYYIDSDYQRVVRDFEESGYTIWESQDGYKFDMAVYHGDRFVLGDQLTASGILTPKTE